MKIALAADHTGFNTLKQIKLYLDQAGHTYTDVGPKALDPNDDYPRFMHEAAKAVLSGQCERGIILGGSGQGEAMAVNRLKGIRCAVFYAQAFSKQSIDIEGDTSHDPYEILKLSRQHNDANMLSLADRFLSLSEIKQAIAIWLDTPFSNIEHHARRIKQLDELN